MANENRATYRYTAVEQREMDRLRQRYSADAEANNLSDMRDTDRRVTLRATIRAVAFGVAGAFDGAGLEMDGARHRHWLLRHCRDGLDAGDLRAPSAPGTG